MTTLLVAAVLTIAIGAFGLRLARGTSWMNSLMVGRAGDAVQFASRDYGVVLDYSVPSLETLDSEVLEKLHQKHRSVPFGDRELRNEGALWGAYIGAVIKRSVGRGHWQTDSRHLGRSAMPFILSDQHEVYPCSWVMKRIENGSEDSIPEKAKRFVEGLEPTSEHVV